MLGSGHIIYPLVFIKLKRFFTGKLFNIFVITLSQDFGLLIMIGGEVDGLPLDDVSIHFLSEYDSKCSGPPNYPLKVSGAVGVVVNHALTVCGGSLKNRDDTESSNGNIQKTADECYRLDRDGWSLVDKLKQSRAFAASIFFPTRGWWITGGISYDHFGKVGERSHLSSTEIIPIFDDDRGDQEYKFLFDEPNLPTEMGLSHHCLVKLDMHRVLVLGGQSGGTVFTSDVYRFDWKRRKWDKLDDLKYGRHSHACSLALGGEYVIVAGGESGYESIQGGGSQTAEIMEVSTGHWHIMPKLSKPIWGGVFVQIGNLPFLIGGSSDDDSHPIQLIEKGDFQQSNQTFNPSIKFKNNRRYSVSIITQEKFVCF
jgi:hypothetical protein